MNELENVAEEESETVCDHEDVSEGFEDSLSVGEEEIPIPEEGVRDTRTLCNCELDETVEA